MELFIIDEKTKLPKANPELLIIPCFKELIRRIRKTPGDSDGREKLLNNKELAYVYYSVKWITGREDDSNIRKLLQMPDDWEPDDLVKECIKKYASTQWTPAVDSVAKIKKTIISLNDFLEKGNNLMKNAGLGDSREVNEFLNVLDRIPKVQDTLKIVEAKLEREQEALAKGRKGRTLNKFELPD